MYAKQKPKKYSYSGVLWPFNAGDNKRTYILKPTSLSLRYDPALKG